MNSIQMFLLLIREFVFREFDFREFDFREFDFRASSALGDGLITFPSPVKVNLTTVNEPHQYKKDVLGEDDIVILNHHMENP